MAAVRCHPRFCPFLENSRAIPSQGVDCPGIGSTPRHTIKGPISFTSTTCNAYMANIVVTGASRGLGLALTRGLAGPGDRAWLISRTEPPGCDGITRTWIPLDLSAPDQLCKASFVAIG